MIVSRIEDSSVGGAIANNTDDEIEDHACVEISYVVLLCNRIVSRDSAILGGSTCMSNKHQGGQYQSQNQWSHREEECPIL